MKPIARCTFILLLLFVLASTAARAGSVVVGSLDLINTIQGPDGVDILLLSNVTGSGATNSTLESLTFSDVLLTINGVDQTGNLQADDPGYFYELDDLAQDSITSFDLTASLGSSPLLVTVNGQQEMIYPTISLSYSGSALDTGSAINNDVQFDVDATVTPEPSTLGLSGTGLALFGVLLWSRRRREQASYAGAGRFFTGIA
jgi:hypothetical protein